MKKVLNILDWTDSFSYIESVISKFAKDRELTLIKVMYPVGEQNRKFRTELQLNLGDRWVHYYQYPETVWERSNNRDMIYTINRLSETQ